MILVAGIGTVFKFDVEVVENGAKREFSARTDMPWGNFRRLVVGMLENPSVELAYKLTSEPGKPSHLKTGEDFANAMKRLCQKALTARTKAVGMEIRNLVCEIFSWKWYLTYLSIMVHRRSLLRRRRRKERGKTISLRSRVKNSILR